MTAPTRSHSEQAAASPVRARVSVEGIVQGVGFRPFVHNLATRLGLAGFVRNDAAGVVIEVEGPRAAVADLEQAIERDAPPLAVVERVTAAPLDTTGETGFSIVDSDAGGARRTLVSPDIATCDDCLAELWDPADRRYRHPFVNCTNCGPRLTIIRDVPYDRPSTTMADLPLCGACRHEYEDPADRRYHAQPVCCPDCGPTLTLTDLLGRPLSVDPVAGCVDALATGAVVAVKGVGGYHLAADATRDDAVAALRDRKHREDKPFAVMARDLPAARELCHIDEAEAAVLSSPRRPIVLLRQRSSATLASAVAPGNRQLGVMLPYTPVHHLLAADLGRPLVLTSGNVSDEPIAYHDVDAYERLAPIADVMLTHDRPIHVRADDSVARVHGGEETVLRRSRGWAPQPVGLAADCPRPILACGAELKHTFAVARGRRAFVSHHVGDLENYETLRAFTDGVEHYCRLFDVVPRVAAHDLHPEYLSTKHAADLEGVELCGVQHHHAHIASCLADNGREGPVIGVAFDGLGYGTDQTIWGGELLVADTVGFERAGHLQAVPLPGGEAAIREPWRMAAAWLDAAALGAPPAELDVRRRNEQRWDDVLAVARSGLNSPATSSMGRLFDAVAALVGVRDRINYEGQAAAELEQLADPAEPGAYRIGIDDGACLVLRGADAVESVVDDLRAGERPARIATRFHRGLARVVVDACAAVRERTGLTTVALSGGVFQNLLLLGWAVDGLERAGFEVLRHHRVPPNDGGISLGQVAVAAARDRRRAASSADPR